MAKKIRTAEPQQKFTGSYKKRVYLKAPSGSREYVNGLLCYGCVNV